MLRRSKEKMSISDVTVCKKYYLFKNILKKIIPFKNCYYPVLLLGCQPTSINTIRISVPKNLHFLNTANMPKSVVGTIFSKFHPFEDKKDQQNKFL